MTRSDLTSNASTGTLSGVLPVVQLPYHDDESIDFETLDKELDWLQDRGVDGLVMAMVTEVLRLSDAERRAVAERICRQRKPGRTVVISVGAESTHHACELAAHAESVGADALMATPPLSVGIDEAQVRRYYERLVGRVEIPVVVQDASGYVGQPMSIAMQARLLEDLGDRVMFKPEATPIGPRLSMLRDATGGKARVFEGTGGSALVDSHRRGIVGTMPGADLIDGIVALWQALETNNMPRIDALSMPICALISMQRSLDAFLAVEKHLLVRQGVFRNTVVRGPVDYLLDAETRKEVDRLFDLMMSAVNG